MSMDGLGTVVWPVGWDGSWDGSLDGLLYLG